MSDKLNMPPAAPAASPAVSSISVLPNTKPLPTVNVAKALGLPEAPSKTINASIKAMQKKGSPSDLEYTPRETPAPTKKNEPAKNTPENNTPSVPKLEPDASKNEPKPIEPAPAPIAEVPKPAAPNKELDELKALLTEQSKQIEALKKGNAPAPKPDAAPGKKEETPEEKAKKVEEQKALRNQNAEHYRKSLPLKWDEKDMDVILEGGKPAVEKMQELLGSVYAEAILATREGLEKDLNPIFDHIYNNIRQFDPVFDDHVQLQRMRVEETFRSKYPELKEKMEVVKSVAKTLYETYPKQMDEMSEAEVFKMIADHTKTVFNQFGVNLTPPPAAAPAAPAPVAAPVTPPPAAEAPKPAPKPSVPGSNAPGVAAAPGSKSSLSKTIAASLID